MKRIGGYFELELNRGQEFHTDAVRLNTGRNALEYILIVNEYSKIYIPFYTCDAILQPIEKLGIRYEFYHIDENFEAQFNFLSIKDNEAFLYTNYFGFKDEYINLIKNKCLNLIIDNAQAFYSRPIKGIDTFYSCRKFFGVPDGAYLYTSKRINKELPQDNSSERFSHLLLRIDEDAESGYKSFIMNEKALSYLPVLRMSEITQCILCSIDYSKIASIRRENFKYLNDKLRSKNPIKPELSENSVPMVYPFYSVDNSLRRKLIDEKVFTAQYWPNVLEWTNSKSLESKLFTNLIHLPIDQRINKSDLNRILKIISQ